MIQLSAIKFIRNTQPIDLNINHVFKSYLLYCQYMLYTNVINLEIRVENVSSVN